LPKVRRVETLASHVEFHCAVALFTSKKAQPHALLLYHCTGTCDGQGSGRANGLQFVRSACSCTSLSIRQQLFFLAESYFSRCRQHGWVQKSHLGGLTQQRVARLLKCQNYVRVSVRSRERDHVIDLPHLLNHVSQLQSLLV
jgi:hypothetical protein